MSDDNPTAEALTAAIQAHHDLRYGTGKWSGTVKAPHDAELYRTAGITFRELPSAIGVGGDGATMEARQAVEGASVCRT